MKRIEDIDRNFRINCGIPEDYVGYPAGASPARVCGLHPDPEGRFCRLPVEFLSECSEGVQTLAWHLAGGCIRFSTDSAGLGVIWQITEKGNMPHFTASAQSGADLYEDTGAGYRHVKNLVPAMDEGCGCKLMQSGYADLPGGMRDYVLYLPLYNSLTALSLYVAPGASVGPGRTPAFEKPIVYYGSSITQGGCACRPGSCYTNIVARRLDAEQRNLGFSGNGKGEENMAKYIASLEMSAFVMDYDHNAPTPEHLAATHEPFFRIIRKAHPELPVVMMSLPDFDSKPESSALRRGIIRRTYENALAAGDKNVYFIDGETFFGDTDRELCTVDGCHPNDLGFLRMADVLTPVLKRALGIG